MADIYHDLHISSSPEKVFECITGPHHLEQWWPLKCSGDAIVGGNYNFYFGEKYDWWGKVVTHDKSKSFHIKMTDSDEDWNPTTFGFDLVNTDQGVWLEFWHKDWPVVNHHFRRSAHCWAMLLMGFKKYIEEGQVIPFEERA